MTPLAIGGAVVAALALLLLVFYIYTWIKGNGQPAKWHVGRIVLALLTLAGGAVALGL